MILPRLSRTSWSALYFTLAAYIMCLSNSIADDLNSNSALPVDRRQVLPDPLQRAVQHAAVVLRLVEWTEADGDVPASPLLLAPVIPDIFVGTGLLLWLLHVLWSRSILRALAIARRTFWLMGTVYLLRAITVVATVLPFSFVVCEPEKPENVNVFYDAWLLLTLWRRSCGDMFFSGHTAMYMVSALVASTYLIHPAIAIFGIVQCLVAVLSLLASGYHYTIDVLVCIFISAVLWWAYHLALTLAPLLEWEDAVDGGMRRRGGDSVTARKIVDCGWQPLAHPSANEYFADVAAMTPGDRRIRAWIPWWRPARVTTSAASLLSYDDDDDDEKEDDDEPQEHVDPAAGAITRSPTHNRRPTTTEDVIIDIRDDSKYDRLAPHIRLRGIFRSWVRLVLFLDGRDGDDERARPPLRNNGKPEVA